MFTTTISRSQECNLVQPDATWCNLGAGVAGCKLQLHRPAHSDWRGPASLAGNKICTSQHCAQTQLCSGDGILSSFLFLREWGKS